MLHVYSLKDNNREIFEKLFKQYYAELGCTDDTAHLVDEYILPDMLAGLLHIDLIEDEGEISGFVIYQIDDITNEWNLKEGWGDIREIYIIPSHRRQGLGKFLLYSAEMKLKEEGAEKAYCLPCESSTPFFTACGYTDSQEYCEDLDCSIYEKTSLKNGCHNE